MIIKNLLEIAFYSSLLVAKKIGSTIEENLPFSKKQEIETVPLRTIKAIPKEETENKKDENKSTFVREKGSKQTTEKEISSINTEFNQKKSTKSVSKQNAENKIKSEIESKRKNKVIDQSKEKDKSQTTSKVKPEKPEIINYSSKTKKELYEIAQEIDLEGRSTMNKAQLLKAIKEHTKK